MDVILGRNKTQKSDHCPPNTDEPGNVKEGIVHIPYNYSAPIVSLQVDESGVASFCVLLVSRLLVNPSSPLPPHTPSASLPFPLIPDCLQIWYVPPIPAPACPSCLAHEADNCLFLRPPLLNSNIGKICCAHSSTMIGERDPQAMCSQIPV